MEESRIRSELYLQTIEAINTKNKYTQFYKRKKVKIKCKKMQK